MGQQINYQIGCKTICYLSAERTHSILLMTLKHLTAINFSVTKGTYPYALFTNLFRAKGHVLRSKNNRSHHQTKMLQRVYTINFNENLVSFYSHFTYYC